MALNRFPQTLSAVKVLAFAASLLAAAAALGTETTAERGDEYVVYVADLRLQDYPYAQDEAPSSPPLREGTRATALGPETEEQNTRWWQVKVGGETGWVRARYLVPAAVYDAAARDGALDTVGDKYVVYGDKLNLRDAPGTDAPVAAVLTAGTVVANRSSHLYHVDDEYGEAPEYWRRVRTGDKEGWLADRYVIPGRIYDIYKEADGLGKGGDGAAMVAALQDLYARAEAMRATAEPWPDNRPEAVDSSPDKRNAFVRTNVGRGLIDEYGEGFTGPIWDVYATLYFVAGRGLVDYYATSEFDTPSGGVWSPDSRYYVFGGDAVDIYESLYKFTVWDSEAEEKRELGQISTKEGQGGVEILNGYVLWLDEQDIAGTPGSVPALVAYNLATGERIRLLKGDVATIPEEPARDVGYYSLYDVIIVPDEPCPPALKASELYRRWNGAHAFVLAGSA